jgi:hypothetical protein
MKRKADKSKALGGHSWRSGENRDAINPEEKTGVMENIPGDLHRVERRWPLLFAWDVLGRAETGD